MPLSTLRRLSRGETNRNSRPECFAPVLEALERAQGGGAAEAGAVESELAKLRERAEAEIARRKVTARDVLTAYLRASASSQPR